MNSPQTFSSDSLLLAGNAYTWKINEINICKLKRERFYYSFDATLKSDNKKICEKTRYQHTNNNNNNKYATLDNSCHSWSNKSFKNEKNGGIHMLRMNIWDKIQQNKQMNKQQEKYKSITRSPFSKKGIKMKKSEKLKNILKELRKLMFARIVSEKREKTKHTTEMYLNKYFPTDNYKLQFLAKQNIEQH